VTVAKPPAGIDATLLGALAGYTGFGAGMNFMLINYYRDKGTAWGTGLDSSPACSAANRRRCSPPE